MGRASGRALKARPPGPFLPGPARPKPDPKSPKARGLFSGRKSADFRLISCRIWAKLWDILKQKNFDLFLAHFRPKIGLFLAHFWPSPKFKNFN